MGKLFSTIGAVALAAIWAAGTAGAGDYLIAASKPNKVFLIDAAARRVVRDCDIPGRGSPLTVSPTTDGKIAYIVTNGWGEISGIELDTCREVFHANMSVGNIRGRIIGAMTVSRDGNWIFVVQSRVERLQDRYNVLPHRIAVYSAKGGFDPAPMRTFEVPRGITILAPAKDGKHLWAGGHDLYKIDMASGEIVETIPILYWQDTRPTYGTPDGLS
ncbi:MAG: quinohemoprotein amine dehydrogenase subunit beta, partial [Alphaproteobacteria bacterium]|nr:quinohemoprotein amine dehydrogenase subunit beta [Alphaproteobacteria bacterium]